MEFCNLLYLLLPIGIAKIYLTPERDVPGKVLYFCKFNPSYPIHCRNTSSFAVHANTISKILTSTSRGKNS